MKKLTPEELQKKIQAQINNIEKLKTMSVKVGIISSGSGVYENGENVVDVGIKHEYGTKDIPRRSFLRTPFFIKKNELSKFINKQFNKVIDQGMPAETALELIGVKAQSISQEAFANNGYGQWQSLSPKTIEKKGSSQPLIDTGTLRNSITYQVTK